MCASSNWVPSTLLRSRRGRDPQPRRLRAVAELGEGTAGSNSRPGGRSAARPEARYTLECQPSGRGACAQLEGGRACTAPLCRRWGRGESCFCVARAKTPRQPGTYFRCFESRAEVIANRILGLNTSWADGATTLRELPGSAKTSRPSRESSRRKATLDCAKPAMAETNA